MTKEKKDKKEKSSNPVNDVIDEYLENNDYNEAIQSLQPLKPFGKANIKNGVNYNLKPSNERIIKSFYQWRGIKGKIAHDLNISRMTLQKWLEKDIELQEAYQDALEYSIDHAESKINELMDGVLVQDYDFSGKPVIYKKPPCIKTLSFFLGNKARHRGYGSKQEIEKPSISFEDFVREINILLDG